MEENYFKKLYDIDVRPKTKKKPGKDELAYLSWSSAWSEVKQVFPDATYTIDRFGENQLPYVYDDETGYLVSTTVTINGITHPMQLPVLNGANKAMKNHPYTYIVKYKGVETEKTVEAATMFDVNTAIMRCLVKNIAVHGLGLYIYEGADLPYEIRENINLQEECMALVKSKQTLSDKAKERVIELLKDILPEENGDPRLCEDNERLEELKKKLLGVRK